MVLLEEERAKAQGGWVLDYWWRICGLSETLFRSMSAGGKTLGVAFAQRNDDDDDNGCKTR